jgi:thiamine phosphate synthase YjbQ (UPF0047 family)
METRIIQFNTSDEIVLTLTEIANGLMVVLVDDKNVSIAIYEFDSEKLKPISRIVYQANNARIHFEGITPSATSEIDSVRE